MLRQLLWLLPGIAMAQFQPPISPTAELRAGMLDGRAIYYLEDAGTKTYEGDILLGEPGAKSTGRGASVTTVSGALWPNATVPYVIDADVANQNLILDAMKQWTDVANIKFVARTTQTNYVRFSKPAIISCNSYVGMQGGEQKVNLDAACQAPAQVHEIGHALGLWHEQTRIDRDKWITLLPQNINKACIHNYDRQDAARDQGAYDFASAMQYPPTSYSALGHPTMETLPPGIPIGDTTVLSAGDIANMRLLYGQSRKIFVSTFPAGLPMIVDGATITSTQTFDWALGTTHTLEAASSAPITSDSRLLFGRWSDDQIRVHTITVDASTSYYTASYVRQFRITTAASPSGSGTVDLSPPLPADGYYNDRAVVLATGRPAAGQFFFRWDGIDKANRGTYFEDGDFAVGSTNPRYFTVTVPKDISMVTSSVPVVIIDTDPPNLQINVDGATLMAPRLVRNVLADGWQPGTSHTLGLPATTQTCRGGICPQDTRFVFQRWTQGGSANQTLNAPNGATRYTAVFERQYAVTNQSNPVGSVRLTPASADGYYADETFLTAVPTASTGFRFREWFGQLVDVDLPANGTAPQPSVCSNPAQIRLAGPLYLASSFESLSSFTPPAAPVVTGTQNGASFVSGPISPGEILTLYGSNFGPSAITSGSIGFDGFVDSCLGQTSFLFDGAPAAILYNSPGQAAVVVPYSVAGKTSVSLVVDSRTRRSAPVALQVAQSSPAVFSVAQNGQGPGLFYHANYTLISSANPAQKGESIFFYATGEGQTDPTGLDGYLVDVARLAKPALPIEVTIGGQKAELQYGGSAPGLISGVMQVNVKVPTNIGSGDQQVALKVGTASSPSTITIAVQ
jgi:uncharacterized protein (TIGR03437 family)